MRRPSYKKMLLVSGLFAAAALLLFAWAVTERVRPLPEAPRPPDGALGTGARLLPPAEPGLALYTDSRVGFFLHYPDAIVPLTETDAMATLGYIPVCDPERALVCFPYGEKEYAGTNFGAAAFSVNLRGDLAGEAACLAPQPGETADGAMSLGGTVFTAFSYADAATSHRLDGRSLRAWRDQGCIELATRIESTVFEVWEPGSIRAFTPDDKADIQAVLEKMMASFRFQENLELL
jgi:hypothetical protein